MAPARISQACFLLTLVVAAHAELGSFEAKEPKCDVNGQKCVEDDVALIQTYTHLAAKKAKGATVAVEGKDGWTVTPSDFANTMTMSAFVEVEGPGTLAAFSGDEVRGVQSEPSVPPFGPYKFKPIYQITIYADTGGETISFKFKPNGGAVVSLKETLVFSVNANVGNVIGPEVLTPMPPAAVTSWTVTPSDFENSMTMSAVVFFDGAIQSAGTLGAFVDGEVRGLQTDPSIPPFGPYKGIAIYQIMIYGDGSGGTVVFKFKSAAGKVTTLGMTKPFIVNAHLGNVISPLLLTA